MSHPFEAIDPRRGGRVFTHDELDTIIKSLRAVGSPYDFIAGFVEAENRPRCEERRMSQ